MGTAPDALLRLIDRFDQDRKVLLSGDYKEEQLRAEFLNGHCLAVRRSDFGVWTFLDPFFTALGWVMDSALDTLRARNWGSVPLSPPLSPCGLDFDLNWTTTVRRRAAMLTTTAAGPSATLMPEVLSLRI